MKSENPPATPEQDVSWPLLLLITTIIVGSLGLHRQNVIYTEGEVMQGLFTLLVGAVAACVIIGFHRRKTAVWCISLLGGALLVWQAWQSHKWTMIHEDVVALVRFIEDSKLKTGRYPATLDGYTFKNARVRSHIAEFGPDGTGGFRLTYFMNHPGISYWYSTRTGFGYYPD